MRVRVRDRVRIRIRIRVRVRVRVGINALQEHLVGVRVRVRVRARVRVRVRVSRALPERLLPRLEPLLRHGLDDALELLRAARRQHRLLTQHRSQPATHDLRLIEPTSAQPNG